MSNNNKYKKFFKEHAPSITVCSSIAILLVATLYFSFNSFNQDKGSSQNLVAEKNKLDLEAVNKSNVKSYKESLTEITTESTTNNTKQANSTETTTEIDKDKKTTENKQDNETNDENKTSTNINDKQSFTMFDESKEMTWPVSGQIIMDYSTEKLVYDKTLDQYRTNDSIAIASPEGSNVLASAEGVVEQIFTDVENGVTVVINHGNGWMSTYSQLDEDVLVAVGQIVGEGEKIGNIGAPSKHSVLLGPHLNFKITKDNLTKDPKLVLAQIEE